MNTDGAGHLGYADVMPEDCRLVLSRDGKVVEERTGAYHGVALDPAKHRYRLDYTVTPAAARVSTSMRTVWEFDSAHTATGTALPLTAVGFAPRLDLDNAARVRATIGVPLTFTQQAGAGGVRSVRVHVSYDDGLSWLATPVVDRTAIVRHPAKAGYVSLRATVVNGAGTTVTQTVLRAYEIR